MGTDARPNNAGTVGNFASWGEHSDTNNVSENQNRVYDSIGGCGGG